MLLYPALDLKSGQVVRLQQGDLKQMTVYSTDPVATGRQWIEAGAQWLHVVNLDGAFALDNANEQIVQQLAALGVPIQFGGGLRSREDVARAFDLGVSRIVIGTLAVDQPDIIGALVSEYGADAVSVALDAKNGKVTTRGWQTVSDVTSVELGQRLYALGLRHALYTDVIRDGELTGVNVAATVELAQQTQLNVIASGGVSGIEDIIALKATGQIAGAILGKSLYAGRLDLREALKIAAGQSV
ncbi:MAG: 1-(5-phosphoribosyl)-5-[(5-phosphoribosylamino)methylideneamino]imidazole-4-carboxamide isomerase [Anaerolineae bacterium]|nr:1-(5-phosphoribosyl)-5-[(5-phosphoribosylamino)methylideneamino]imidazole-4-carboxamide isomerase [Anaerolineae bacterium]